MVPQLLSSELPERLSLRPAACAAIGWVRLAEHSEGWCCGRRRPAKRERFGLPVGRHHPPLLFRCLQRRGADRFLLPVRVRSCAPAVTCRAAVGSACLCSPVFQRARWRSERCRVVSAGGGVCLRIQFTNWAFYARTGLGWRWGRFCLGRGRGPHLPPPDCDQFTIQHGFARSKKVSL